MKPECPKGSEVSAFVDGELSGAAAMRMEAHLALCHRCSELLHAYQRVDRQIDGLAELSVSSSFDSGFRERLEKLSQPPRWWERLKRLLSGWRPIWAAGAAVCLVALVFRYHGEENPALSLEEIIMVEHLELFQDFELIEKLELFESRDDLKDRSAPT
jgi:anti-sigma factor RsiW